MCTKDKLLFIIYGKRSLRIIVDLQRKKKKEEEYDHHQNHHQQQDGGPDNLQPL